MNPKDLEPTPPPAKKEPDDVRGSEEEEDEEKKAMKDKDGSMKEELGDVKEELDEAMGEADEAYKSLLAELAPAAPAAPPPPAHDPDPVPYTEDDDAVYLEADQLLKSVQQYVDHSGAALSSRLLKVAETGNTSLRAQAALAKTVGVLTEQVETLTKSVESLTASAGMRRGTINIYDPPTDTGPAQMSPAEYQAQGMQFLAKSLAASKKGLVPTFVPGVVQTCINRGLPLASQLSPGWMAAIQTVEVD